MKPVALSQHDPGGVVRPPRLSIIVPCYNSETTIGVTVESVLRSDFRDFELIVVDDCSTDRSAEIAARLGAKVLKLENNLGAANARNAGARQAAGEIVVFVDADVALPKEALGRISDDLVNDGISCVQAIYSRHCPIENFPSQYQNLYQFYNFDQIRATHIQIASTYCFAVRRRDFIELNVRQRTAEDGEWGYRLFRQGKPIFLDKGVQVEHHQRFTLGKVLKRSYRISADKAASVKRYREQAATSLGKTHHSWQKVAAILCSPIPPLFWLLNLRFFRFVLREKGGAFLVKTVVFHEANYLASLFGLVQGTLRSDQR